MEKLIIKSLPVPKIELTMYEIIGISCFYLSLLLLCSVLTSDNFILPSKGTDREVYTEAKNGYFGCGRKQVVRSNGT